ncbi:MAG TPA: LEA type 2 family protein [Steroidobacteraceae bacterium]|nr:LEA type 2 family protein [Steroidobacteraceae bacterium]
MRLTQVRRGFAFICLLLCTPVLILGCASGPKFVAPKLTLVTASMMSADVFAQQFRVRLHVDNPNDRELPIRSIEYKLFLEGDGFAEGTSEASFVVPANGEKEFDLTMQTNFVSSIGRLLSRMSGTNRSSVQYSLTGKVIIDKRFGPKLDFAETGTVDLGRK